MEENASEEPLGSSSKESFRPRGTKVLLPHGGLPEVIPTYLQRLIEATGGAQGPIGLQFVAQPEIEQLHYEGHASDPLMEDEHLVAPGLVYKYKAKFDDAGNLIAPGRALWTITFACAAYCRFCTRGREVGVPSGYVNPETGIAHSQHLPMNQIEKSLAYIESEPGLNEIILSGGDPLTLNPKVLLHVLTRLGQLQQQGKLAVVRIGTRVPIHNPIALRETQFDAIKQLKKPRLMIHINHPAELTSEAISVIDRLQRDCGAIVMSQTVLLKGVNDHPLTLRRLFEKLAGLGVVPYYVYQNDPVYWAEHFTVPIDEAIALWQMVRPLLSGVAATARFVIDTPGGYGKIPMPEGGAFPDFHPESFIDFTGKEFDL